MLHYSNASSIEKNRRYLVIKGGGLAWLLWQGGVVNSVVELGSSSVGLPKRRGGRNNEYNANRCMTMHDKAKRDARRALTRYEVMPVKGGNIRESIHGVSIFQTDEPEGKSSMFAMLSGFVSSF